MLKKPSKRFLEESQGKLKAKYPSHDVSVGTVEKTTPSLGQNSFQHPPNPILCKTKRVNELATLLLTLHFNHHPLPIHGNTFLFHFSTGISSRYKTSPLQPTPHTLCFSTGILSRFEAPHSPLFFSREYSPVLLSTGTSTRHKSPRSLFFSPRE